MDASCATQPRIEPATAFELKGTVTPVTVLCLHTADVDRIVDELRVRIAPVPQMFLNAPVVVDLAEVRELDIPLGVLAERLRACKLVPVGIAHAGAEQLARAAEAGLAILQLSRQRATDGRGDGRSEARAASENKGQTNGHSGQSSGASGHSNGQTTGATSHGHTAGSPANGQTNPAMSTLTVKQPVRSGQVIYAQRADLVVLGPVNPGAQVIADGHVHVYGPLRGRALAGAQGFADARVFCQSLEAELVPVNGQYLTADEIPSERRQRPSQLFVEDGRFRVLPL